MTKQASANLHIESNGNHNGVTHPDFQYNPVVEPIYTASTFFSADIESYINYVYGENSGPKFRYGRYHSPNENFTVRKLCALDGVEDGLLFSSGMAALMCVLMTYASTEKNIVITNFGYLKLRRMIGDLLVNNFDKLIILNPEDKPENIINEDVCLVLIESPSNYLSYVYDVERICTAANSVDALSVFDNTAATAINQRPISFGTDLIAYSVTKYLSGHNDICGGAILGNKAEIDRLRSTRDLMGSILDPRACYELSKGLKTLEVRMNYINTSTHEIALFLRNHPAVSRCWYSLFSETETDFPLRDKLAGGGGIVHFQLAAGYKAIKQFLQSLKIPLVAGSFGGTETMIRLIHPHEFSAPPALFRLSVGLEKTDALISDIDQAFAHIEAE